MARRKGDKHNRKALTETANKVETFDSLQHYRLKSRKYKPEIKRKLK